MENVMVDLATVDLATIFALDADLWPQLVTALSALLLGLGLLFFLAGTAALLRFPDFYSKLHGLTKADNLGLGMLISGLLLQAGGALAVVKLVLLWLLVLIAGALSCVLLARYARRRTEGMP